MTDRPHPEVTYDEPDDVPATEDVAGPEVSWAAYPPSQELAGPVLPEYVPPAGRPDPVRARTPFKWVFLIPLVIQLPNLMRMAAQGDTWMWGLIVVMLLVGIGSLVYGLASRAELSVDGEGMTLTPRRGRAREPIRLHWVELRAVRLRGAKQGKASIGWLPGDARATFPSPCERRGAWWVLPLGNQVDVPKLAKLLKAYGPPDFTQE